MRKKILIAIFILFSLVFVMNTYQVSARGVVSQGFKYTDKDQNIYNALVFRTYATPHIANIETYYNEIQNNNSYATTGYQYYYNGTKISKWRVTLEPGNGLPRNDNGVITFSAIRFAFHTSELGKYDDSSSGEYGYNKLSTNIALDKNLLSISNAYDNSIYQRTNVGTNDNYSSNVYYEIESLIPTGEYKIGYDAGIATSGYIVGKVTEYRYAIIGLANGANVLVTDNIIFSEDLEAIQKANNYKSTTYVSEILSAKKNDIYQIAKTPYDIYPIHPWSYNTRGTISTSKGLGSIINLYDNILEFPQMSKRTVVVRHINVGLNNSINTNIVNNGTKIPWNNTKAKPRLWNLSSKKFVYGDTVGEKSGYQVYFQNKLNINEGFTVEAYPDTSTYKCIGSNVATAANMNSAEIKRDGKIAAGMYDKNTKSVTIQEKSYDSTSDYTVIDFYYAEYEKEVEVNHIIVDKDGVVKDVKRQQMPAGDIAYEIGIGNINRTNSDKTVKEIYKKRLGINIKVFRRPDEALGNEYNIDYYGYETFNTIKSLSSLVGTKININKKASSEVTITGDIKQVNFYYCIEQEIPYEEPEKEIGGKVFVSASNKGDSSPYEASCYDDEGKITINSIPTASYAKVGVKDLPRYMVGSIYTKYTPSEEPNKLNINVKLTYGNETKTVTYSDFKYKAGYYRVTDMSVYELQSETIYDADNGKNDTLGDKLFNWNSKTLDKSDITNMSLNVTLSGINGKTIKNTLKDIENISNYVSVSIKDKYGFTSGSGATNTTFNKIFLTEAQIKEVDATNYDPLTNKWDKSVNEAEYTVINKNDKTYADSKLNEYKESLESTKVNILNKQNDLQKVKDKLASLENTYNEATGVLNTKQKAYDTELSIMLINKKAYDNEKQKLQDIENEIKEKNKELEEIDKNIKEKLELMQNANEELNKAEYEKTSLYEYYEAKVAERSELEINANCIDIIDNEIYIYMEQEEKDKLEKCKEAKRKYQENLDNNELESANEAYLTYLNESYQKTLDNATNAKIAYDEAVKLKSDIDKEISELELKKLVLNIQVMTLMRTYVNHYDGEYKAVKEDLENYKNGEYKKAKNEYEEYRDGNYISNAEYNLTEAKDEYEVAQANYNKYNTYRTNLYAKYDEYKAIYEEYLSLINSSSEEVAATLGLQVQIKVQNMSVIVKNGTTSQNLFKEGTDLKNSVTETISLSNYIETGKTIEVYTSKPEIDKSIYSNIGGTLIKVSDYNIKNNLNYITAEKLNGIRVLSGEVTYKTKVIIGDKSAETMKDNVYYSDKSTEDKTAVFTLAIGKELNKKYKYKNSDNADEKYESVEPINVYTPITVSSEIMIDDSKVVDQSNSDTDNLSVIQLNTPFTLNLTNDKQDKVYSMADTSKYRAGFYVKFSFDVYKVKINGKAYKSGSIIKAGTWIGIIQNNSKGKAYIEAQPYANLSSDRLEALTEENNTYTVRAVAVNATHLMLDESTKYETLEKMKDADSSLSDSIFNICKNPSYFEETKNEVVIMNRVYEFRVTDLKDLDWKNVFRSTKSTTNAHTGTVYYSGTTKWNYISDKSNSIISRSTSEIGRNPIRTLPLGPYKNTNTSYVKAPKMGYRFSFDFKVTGSYYKDDASNAQIITDRIRIDKKVKIATKFYYISKDGKTYYPEYTNGVKGIYLFYKNSSEQYVRVDNKGGDYELTFIPNDGYRLVEDRATETLATKNISLGNLRNITLNYQMATVTDNGAAITYYGDYKLPNSTIAVLVNEDGTYDINKQLKDGYIGVIFDINVYTGTAKVGENAEKNIILSYNKNTKVSENTSQWDYEGFLGYTRVGNAVHSGEISVKLEKGIWQIDNDMYNDIKGTVILYDTDQRAATDYD